MAPSRDSRADPYALLSLFSTHLKAEGEELPPDHPLSSRRVPTRVFVLGINERRVTVYSQQCRALNLIWLLHETRVLTSSGRVAVVGAGAGGLTAAAAAACKGHRVLLLNKSLDRMPQQRFARHRWLHPRIFDWPAEGWWRARAELPLLDWSAGDAHSVRRAILADFDTREFQERIHYKDNLEGVRLEPATRLTPRPKVSWSPNGDESPEEVDAVVLAVGFGVDGTDDVVQAPVYWDSYWDDPGARWTSPGHVLISGGGDGGLTEVLHAAFGEEFEHRRILELAGCRKGKQKKWVRNIADEILAFEQAWRHRYRPPATEGRRTMDFFRRIPAPEVDEQLDKLGKEGKQGSRTAARQVTLIVKDDDFAVTSCALNRFLVARLKGAKIVEGSLDTKRSFERSEKGILALVKPMGDGKATEYHVDSIVIRHGTEEDSQPLRGFQKWVEPDVGKLDFGGTAAALLDASRQRRWPDGFYDSCIKPGEPGEPTPDLAVLLARGEAKHLLRAEPPEADEATRILVAALEAAAMAGLALTPTAVERIARVPHQDASDIVAALFQPGLDPEAGLTIADEQLERRRAELPDERKSDARAARQGPATRARVLGNVRAGTLIGAWMSDPDVSGDHAERIAAALRDDALPWWTVHGYAAARYDHAPTQLAFAHQFLSIADSAEAPDDAAETAYTAVRRAIRGLRAGDDDPDPELWADALVTAGELMAHDAGDERAKTLTGELEKRWGMDARDRAFAAGLFALRALEPDWPGRWDRLLQFFFGGSVSPAASSRDRLVHLASVVEPKEAAEVLRQLADPSTQPDWGMVLKAEKAASEMSENAAVHVRWVVDGE